MSNFETIEYNGIKAKYWPSDRGGYYEGHFTSTNEQVKFTGTTDCDCMQSFIDAVHTYQEGKR